ncbi:protein kinase domain-containing protein [Parafrankia elaeagni]|uniref:protein kinase domain-containing protein n=1 Tax=Parafrankia elaeagni TaxID=222534 RepID=UPI00036698E4|nr:protein kinase [Parafrankia elaeagni]
MAGFSGAGATDSDPSGARPPTRSHTHARATAAGAWRRAHPAVSCPVCASPLGRAAGRGAGRAGAGGHLRESGFCPRCRTPYSFAPPLRAGDVAGGYEIVDCLGAGGPGPGGWVFLAVAPGGPVGAGRRVVLKSLRRAGARPAPLSTRFSRRPLPDPPLRHPAIVETLGEVRHGNIVYTVMDFVPGPSLAELLRSRRLTRGAAGAPLPVPDGIAGALRLLSALRYVHERGYVHGDLAPGNVVWNGDQVTLIDLQSVRQLGRRCGAFHVTAGFDAPELAMRPPSVGSDLYALGRLLATAVLDFPHRASTYRYALPAEEVHQVLARNESLHRFLLRATATDPARRFGTAGDMTAALAAVAANAAPQRPADAEPRPAGAQQRPLTRQKAWGAAEVPEHARAAGVLQGRTSGIPRRTGGR